MSDSQQQPARDRRAIERAVDAAGRTVGRAATFTIDRCRVFRAKVASHVQEKGYGEAVARRITETRQRYPGLDRTVEQLRHAFSLDERDESGAAIKKASGQGAGRSKTTRKKAAKKPAKKSAKKTARKATRTKTAKKKTTAKKSSRKAA